MSVLHLLFGISLPVMLFGLDSMMSVPLVKFLDADVISGYLFASGIGSLFGYILIYLIGNAAKKLYLNINYLAAFSLSIVMLAHYLFCDADIGKYIIFLKFAQGFLCSILMAINYFVISLHGINISRDQYIKGLISQWSLIGCMLCIILSHISIKHFYWRSPYLILFVLFMIYAVVMFISLQYNKKRHKNLNLIAQQSQQRPKRFVQFLSMKSFMYSLMSGIATSAQVVLPVLIHRYLSSLSIKYYISGNAFTCNYTVFAFLGYAIVWILCEFVELTNRSMLCISALVSCALIYLSIANNSWPMIQIAIIVIFASSLIIYVLDDMLDNACEIITRDNFPSSMYFIQITSIICGIIFEMIFYHFDLTWHFAVRLLLIVAIYSLFFTQILSKKDKMVGKI